MLRKNLPLNYMHALAGLACLCAVLHGEVCMADEDRLTVQVKLDSTFSQDTSDQMFLYLCPGQWTGLSGDVQVDQSTAIPAAGLTFSFDSALGVLMYVYWLPDGEDPMSSCPSDPVNSNYRLQLIELTYNTPSGPNPQNGLNVCDISCVDYYGLPVSVSWGNQKESFNMGDASIQKNLLGVVNPSSPDFNSVLKTTDSGDFLRVVAPLNVGTSADPPAYWDPTPYMNYMFDTYQEGAWPSLITTDCPNSINQNGCFESPNNSYSFSASLVADSSTDGSTWESLQLTGKLGHAGDGGPWQVVTGTPGNVDTWVCNSTIDNEYTVTMTLPREQFAEYFYSSLASAWNCTATPSGSGDPVNIDLSLNCCNQNNCRRGNAGTTTAQQCCQDAIASFANGLALGMTGSSQNVNCNACGETSAVACQPDNWQWFTKSPTGNLQVDELSSEEWKYCFSAVSSNWGPQQPFYNQYADVIYTLSGGTVYGMPVADQWKAGNPLAVKPIDGSNHLLISVDPISTTPPSPASGDVNGDGVVDYEDISALMNTLGFRHHDSDFDRDVDGEDLSRLLGSWGFYGDTGP